MFTRVLDPYVVVTAGALSLALVQSLPVKTPAGPPPASTPSAPSGAARGSGPPRFFIANAAFSPDGRRIAFSRYSGEGPFDPARMWAWVADRDGAHARPVLGAAFGPRFAPDGERLVATVRRGGSDELATFRLDGGDVRPIARGIGKIHGPVFSPDGRYLLIGAEVDGNLDVYRIDADGKGLHRLTTDPARDFNPEISPDSRRAVFYRETGDQHDQIWTLDLATGSEQRLTDGTGHNYYPSFLPDGRIAFSGDASGERRLMVEAGDGKRFEPLGPPGVTWARWSPDGREILFLVQGRPGTLLRMSAAGRDVVEVLDAAAMREPPAN